MTPFQNPTIYIGDLRIDEPITTLTDLIFIGVCFFAFFKTKHVANNTGANLYRWFFLLTGASTLVAALIGHAFLYYFGAEAKIYGWAFGIFSIAASQLAAINHSRLSIGEKAYKILLIGSVTETLTAFVLTFVFWTFIVVEIHTAFSLAIVVTILEFINYKKTNSKLSLNMIYGVGIAIIAVMCHIFKIAYSVWFNHIDLSHIFMTLSIYVMYKGVAKFKPAEIK